MVCCFAGLQLYGVGCEAREVHLLQEVIEGVARGVALLRELERVQDGQRPRTSRTFHPFGIAQGLGNRRLAMSVQNIPKVATSALYTPIHSLQCPKVS